MTQISTEILEKYAQVLINFGLNGGKGVSKGEKILVYLPEDAKEFLKPLQKAILEANSHPIIYYLPDNSVLYDSIEKTNKEQREFIPEKTLKGLVDEANHFVKIKTQSQTPNLEPNIINELETSEKKLNKLISNKESKGKLSRTLATFPTKYMAQQAGMNFETYCEEIIRGCYLDYDEPIKEWKKIFSKIEDVKKKLDQMPIKKLNIKGKNTNLDIGIDENRKWLGGSGRNIPSYEIFISPHKYKTNGYFYSNIPAYIRQKLVEGIYVEFSNGKVTKYSANKGEDALKDLLSQKNMDFIGEFSLTDKRLSRITKFMARTLFDENIGGEEGNTHIAFGNSYKQSYPNFPIEMENKEWDELGFNQADEHLDIISTQKRVVTATLDNNKEIIIYENGEFKI